MIVKINLEMKKNNNNKTLILKKNKKINKMLK